MSHFSFRSCIGVNELFKVMFSDSEIAKSFQLSKTKCAYFINYGISPLFKEQLVNEIISSPCFVVSFDESMNRILQEEQMDIQVRYWDNINGIVNTRYLDSTFLKRPNAKNLVDSLQKCIVNIPQKNMLQLSMDGPSTNWNVLKMLNEYRSEKEYPTLIDIGCCGLHVIHGSFQTGVKATGWKLDGVLKAMWQIFHDSPARRDVYIQITRCDLFPLRYFNYFYAILSPQIFKTRTIVLINSKKIPMGGLTQ